MKTNGKKLGIVVPVMLSCAVMGVVDALIQPGYLVKSIIKLSLFLVVPLIVSRFADCDFKSLFKPRKKGLLFAALAGAGIFAVILAAFFLLRNVFDFSSVTAKLTEGAGVDKSNFVFVALYISFVNSLLEEFFFRGFAFLTLEKTSSRRFAYVFSSAAFALYHITMIIGWFGLPVIALAVTGLFAGGLIFDFFNEKYGNIYMSWLIHMSANFATNTIGFILFAASAQ